MRKANSFQLPRSESRDPGRSTIAMKYFSQICFLLLMAAAAAAQTIGPADTVRAFYDFDRTHSTEFSNRSVEARRPWFSGDLYRLLRLELQREADYLKRNPGDKPHYGDGLPFRPLDESCDVGQKRLHKKISIKPGVVGARAAKVTVTFAFPPPCKTSDRIEYIFSMKRSGKRWTIDNVTYDDGSTLVGDLNRKEY